MLPGLAHRPGAFGNGGPPGGGLPATPAGPAAAAAARSITVCRSAASPAVPAAAPAPPAAHGGEREQRWRRDDSSLSVGIGGSTGGIGSHAVRSSWLVHSLRVQDLPPVEVDLFLEQLRRQIGTGGRWAWQDEEDEWEALQREDDFCCDLDPGLECDEGEEEQREEAAQREAERAGQQRRLRRQRRAASDGAEKRAGLPLVRSVRGARQRRGSGQQHCRGRALAGAGAAAVHRGTWPRALPMRTPELLPECLLECRAGSRLTAEQEALLGELVQAGRQADAILQQLASRGEQYQRQRQRILLQLESGVEPGWEQCLVLEVRLWQAARRGAVARQLLCDCNARLVSHIRRRMVCRAPPCASLRKELNLAGQEALWRASGRYQPSRHQHTRFSTYAGAAIRNAMLDALDRHLEPVHVRSEARVWARQVLRAAWGLKLQEWQQQQEQQQEPQGWRLPPPQQLAAQGAQPQPQHLEVQAAWQQLAAQADWYQQQQRQQQQQSGVPDRAGAARPQPQQGLLRRPGAAHQQRLQQQQQRQQQQQPPSQPTGLERLAAAAQLQEYQVKAGLAAAQRQHTASFESLLALPSEASAGSTSQPLRRQLVLFSDIEEEEGELSMEAEAAEAAEVVEWVLSHLAARSPKQRQKLERVLRLRFNLGRLGDPAQAEGEELAFEAVGRRMGLSRQGAQKLYHQAVQHARKTAASMWGQ